MKILTVHASAGSGHRSAALAINAALAEQGNEAILADILSFASPGFRFFYGRGYEFSAQHLRWLCRLVYGATDRPAHQSRLVEFIERNHAAKVAGLEIFLRENKVETVCATHFLPTRLVADLRRKGLYKGRLDVCVTDYQAHGFWVDQDVDRYYVATAKAAERLLDWGLPGEKIQVTGIPVRPGFGPGPDAVKAGDEPWRVLLMGSSMKIKEVLICLADLAALHRPLTITLVTGRNLALFQALEQYSAPPHLRFDLRGQEQHMERLMAESDFMVTKPGGIICSEGLCAGLPMLFVAPIPKHEIFNAQILAEAGAGLIAFGQNSLKSALKQLADNPAKLDDMRRAALLLAHPGAARDIAQNLLAL